MALIGMMGFALAFVPLWVIFESMIAKVSAFGADYIDANPKLRIKMQDWLSTVVVHIVMAACWWTYAFSGEDWIFDTANWVTHLDPPAIQGDDAQQIRDKVYYIYLGSLSYCWHSMIKDGRRSLAQFKDIAQVSFILHHVLAIFLTALSFEYDLWRCGVITRLIHDVGDIPLYIAKYYLAICAAGKGSYISMCCMYVLNIFTWWSSRVICYAYLVYKLAELYLVKGPEWTTDANLVGLSLLLSSALMWVLQAAWGSALIKATFDFITTGQYKTNDGISRGQPAPRPFSKDKGKVEAVISAAIEPDSMALRRRAVE